MTRGIAVVATRVTSAITAVDAGVIRAIIVTCAILAILAIRAIRAIHAIRLNAYPLQPVVVPAAAVSFGMVETAIRVALHPLILMTRIMPVVAITRDSHHSLLRRIPLHPVVTRRMRTRRIPQLPVEAVQPERIPHRPLHRPLRRHLLIRCRIICRRFSLSSFRSNRQTRTLHPNHNHNRPPLPALPHTAPPSPSTPSVSTTVSTPTSASTAGGKSGAGDRDPRKPRSIVGSSDKEAMDKISTFVKESLLAQSTLIKPTGLDKEVFKSIAKRATEMVYKDWKERRAKAADGGHNPLLISQFMNDKRKVKMEELVTKYLTREVAPLPPTAASAAAAHPPSP